MYLSPLVTVGPILAAMIVGAVWLAPPQRQVSQVTVMLPADTYQKLALWGKQHASAKGRPLTIAQVIEELTNKWAQVDDGAAANQSGMRVR